MGVILDHAEQERRFENRLNAVIRHCRIGKVTRKPYRSSFTPPAKPWQDLQPVIPGDFLFAQAIPFDRSTHPVYKRAAY